MKNIRFSKLFFYMIVVCYMIVSCLKIRQLDATVIEQGKQIELLKK